MPDKTLGAYQRHEPLTADDFANADFARHADGRIARRANPDLWVYNQSPSSAPVWSVCRDMAEDGGWSPVRGCPDPDVHLDRDAGDAAVRWMIRTKEREARAQQAEKERDDARALLAEAQEEATRQAARADQAELDRDNARRWLRETEALLDQAGHERDEARAERDHFHEVAATFRDKFNAAESHPLTPDAITNEMAERARKRGSELVGALWDPEVVEAMLTAALTPEPERPDGAEEIEAVLREEWTFSDEDGGGDAFGDLAQRLASRGVRVVGEEDR